MGVLNRIALCYLFGGLVFCFCNTRVMIALAASLLLGYWAALALEIGRASCLPIYGSAEPHRPLLSFRRPGFLFLQHTRDDRPRREPAPGLLGRARAGDRKSVVSSDLWEC